jgi:DNA-nicking Smr family endonuclease
MTASKLSHEDRILWSKVARTATPLRGTTPMAALKDRVIEISDTARPSEAIAVPVPVRPAGRGGDQGRLHPLDQQTRNKLSKGRLPIEARVDLHGLTQAEAHNLLISFLHRAFAQGVRHVLVITGKGSSLGSDGILRRAVPAWFSTPPFRPLVGGYDTAARGHGGAGALYVRLRRQSDGRT